MIRTSDVDGDAAVLLVDNSNVITHYDVVLNIIVLHGTSLCSLTATIILKFAFVWPDRGGVVTLSITTPKHEVGG